MFIPGCQCCGGTAGTGCTCQCPAESPPPECITLRISLGTVTSVTGGSFASGDLAKFQGLAFTARSNDGFRSGLLSCGHGAGLFCINPTVKGYFVSTNASNPGFPGNIVTNWTNDGAPDCTEWFLQGSANFTANLAAGQSQATFSFRARPTENFTQQYQFCGLTGTKTLNVYDAGGTTPFVRFTIGSVVLNYENAVFTIEPGCGYCGCSSCDDSATLDGTTYRCVPPSVTISLDNVTTTEGGLPNNDTTTLAAVKSTLDNLPGVVASLISATQLCNGAFVYQGEYSLGANVGKIVYKAILYCDACGDYQGGIGVTTTGSTVSLGACASVKFVAAAANAGWAVATGKNIDFMYFGATGLWANAGAQIPAPTLSITTVCSGAGSTGVYDATSNQDSGPAQVAVSGYYPLNGTLYFTEATITVSVP